MIGPCLAAGDRDMLHNCCVPELLPLATRSHSARDALPAHLLESCEFKQFWIVLREEQELVELVSNTKEAVRNCESQESLFCICVYTVLASFPVLHHLQYLITSGCQY